jgi:hypothetical protein
MVSSGTLRIAAALIIALPATGAGAALHAQEALEETHAIGAEVPLVLAVRSKTNPTFRAGSLSNTSTRLEVAANAPHDVLVRLDGDAGADGLFFVRDAAGVFRRLDAGRPVAVALDAPAGRSALVVAWRAEAVGAGGATPRISYELVASGTATASRTGNSRSIAAR